MNHSKMAAALVCAVMVCAALSACAPLCPHKGKTFIHFFVVPKQLPNGQDATDEIAALKQWLAQTAGGYTELGDAPGGWINPENTLETARQTAFFLSAPRNLRREISDYIRVRFKERQPYVMTWKALG